MEARVGEADMTEKAVTFAALMVFIFAVAVFALWLLGIIERASTGY